MASFLSLMLALLFVAAVHPATSRHLHTDFPSSLTSVSVRNNRPLIGVLSQPGEPAPKGYSYIAASYVKMIESAGGRVVPIQYDLPAEDVRKRFNAINGVLIPGGSAVLHPGHPFYDTTSLLFNLTLDANDKGDYFPIHGTCLGFETLAIIASRNTSLLARFDAEDNASPLYMTEDAEDSYFFGAMPKQVADDLQNFAYSMENHAEGVSFAAYDENPHLKDFFKVLSLSVDRLGGVYISTMEARKYPITATQWHPEKNAFEWAAHLHIPHSPEAIDVTTAVAKYILREARKSTHKPGGIEEEDKLLIYNYHLEFTGKHTYPGEETDFDEAYFFPEIGTLADA
ncbi:hypothetical protein WJX72_006292 [[Myrmecia] bisecta]|uniref:folate gamma-glutamyl hydrolase n=1 Tax=[Myrmecia] bisecta TaxID=41462 RepID=A0AAW1QS53_9CHLO